VSKDSERAEQMLMLVDMCSELMQPLIEQSPEHYTYSKTSNKQFELRVSAMQKCN